jgi:hypothetical protein
MGVFHEVFAGIGVGGEHETEQKRSLGPTVKPRLLYAVWFLDSNHHNIYLPKHSVRQEKIFY